MKQRMIILSALTLLWSSYGVSTAQTTAQSPQNNGSPKSAQTAQRSPTEGERRFQINCGRCHNFPEDISPREARAVVRHMRVRAMLTAEDEKLILEFLAP
jgi:cytochrome c5